MKTKQIWGNLAVADLDRTTTFYTKLGFELNGTPNTSLTSFRFGAANFVINFFRDDRLKANTHLEIIDANLGNEVIFSLSAESKEEVDEWTTRIKNAGGTIFSEPQDFEQGYFFIFADPDGHKFNVLYWPGM